MYNRILVPVDGSSFSEAALPLAVELSAKSGASLHLVLVLEPQPPLIEGPPVVEGRDVLTAYLEGLAERARYRSGGRVTTRVREGYIVDALLDEAEDEAVDLIVMASHGRGAFGRAWLGSVAKAMSHDARVPVILVRPGKGTDLGDEQAPALRTILVPMDGSELSEGALEHAVELGQLAGSAYHLTRVVVFPGDIGAPYMPTTTQINQDIVTDAKREASKYLEEHAERLRWRGLSVTTSVAVDTDAGNGILAEAQAVGCDLIAMSTHARSGIQRLVLGSAADKVLRRSHVPLMLYRPAEVGVAAV